MSSTRWMAQVVRSPNGLQNLIAQMTARGRGHTQDLPGRLPQGLPDPPGGGAPQRRAGTGRPSPKPRPHEEKLGIGVQELTPELRPRTRLRGGGGCDHHRGHAPGSRRPPNIATGA